MSGWNESAWFSFLVGAAFKGTLVLGAAWLSALILRRRSAAARHLVWTAAAVAVLALPLLTVALPVLNLGGAGSVLDSGTLLIRTTATARSAGTAALPVSGPTRGAVGTRRAEAQAASPWQTDWRLWVMLLWGAGAALAAAQVAVACLAMWRAGRRSQPFADRDLVARLTHSLDIVHVVEVLETSQSSMPMTFGVFRPTVYLPAGAAEWPEERRRLVLLHELAPVRRGDTATHWLARAVVGLYWWNPLAWMAWRAFLKERELAADDLVLQAGARASEYASQLLEIARTMQTGPAAALAGVAMARKSQLEGRLLAILDPAIPRGTPRRLTGVAGALLAVALVAPLAAVHAQNQTDPALAADLDATIRAANSQKNHEILDQAAKAALAQGKLEVAKKLLNASVAIREQVSGPQSIDYGLGLVKLGELAQREHRADDALSYYTRAIQAMGDRPETVHALLDMGIIALSNRDSESAFGYFQRAERADPAHSEAAVMWMAVIRARKDETAAEAESLFQRALSMQGSDHLERAATMDLYAGLLRRTGRTDEAAALAAQAAAVRRVGHDRPLPAAKPTLAEGTYRVGNGVTSPIPIYKPEPSYSEVARLAKYGGEVTLSVTIQSDGVPADIQVVSGLGLGLDEAALDAVSQWRFKPGTKNGVPVAVQAMISVNFRLL
jgi:TonB family protein